MALGTMAKMHPSIEKGLAHDKTEIYTHGKLRERMDAERRIEKADRIYRKEKLKADALAVSKRWVG